MTLYRLPDGKTTRSIPVYLKAWRALADPLCEATGWTVYGWDPGVAFRTRDGLLTLTVGQIATLTLAIGKGRR